jgi:hypothetical protein
MRMCARIAWVAGWCFALAASASAQMGGGMGMRRPQVEGVFSPVVGHGAAYEVAHQGGKDGKSQEEITVVGKESVDGKDAYWIEFTVDSPRGEGQMVMKSLIVLDGQNTRTEKMIMQLQGMDPMEMSGQMLARRGNQTQSADIRSTTDDIGPESVTTPAGTFACEHFRAKDGSSDYWIAKNVSPWGLVKSTSKENSMILVKVITDAKDKITGTPKPFNPMGMGRPQPN